MRRYRSCLLLSTLCSLSSQLTGISAIATDSAERYSTCRFVAEVTYDGSDFSGWQLQSTKRSVQGTLNDVLSSIYEYPVKVCGASRTDKGVHARGQMIHFDLPGSLSDKDTIESITSLNQQLPDDIKVKRWAHAPAGLLDIQIADGLPWHAVENAISKHYSFVFSTAGFLVDPMTTRYRANLHNYKASHPMNVELFQEALNVFKGTHDFRAFGNRLDIRAKISEEYSGQPFSSLRTIFSADIVEIRSPSQYSQFATVSSSGIFEEIFYRVDIVLDGALYKMLRNIIAGCVEVGYGTMSLQELGILLGTSHVALGSTTSSSEEVENPLFTEPSSIIKIPSRADNRIVTAPACGLYLEKVTYREVLFP